MMNQARLRSMLRWLHVAVGAYLGAYIYSPFHADPFWTDLTRYGVFPVVGLSGAWMWQQGRVARWMKQRGHVAARA